MKPVYTFLIYALGLVVIYIVLTSANQNNGAASTLIGTGFGRLRDSVKILQGN